jgi:hypothetical protein
MNKQFNPNSHSAEEEKRRGKQWQRYLCHLGSLFGFDLI